MRTLKIDSLREDSQMIVISIVKSIFISCRMSAELEGIFGRERDRSIGGVEDVITNAVGTDR